MPTTTHGKTRMWTPSPATAARLYDLANIAFLVSLAVGVVSTALVIWMGNHKETYLRRELAATGLRAADANKAAEEARLALEQLRARLADRVLTPELAAKLRAFAASQSPDTRLDVFTIGTSVEIANLKDSIVKALSAGGWNIREWEIVSGHTARGIVVGSDRENLPMAHIADELARTLTAAGFEVAPNDLRAMPIVGATMGEHGADDAPLRMFIGSKQ